MGLSAIAGKRSARDMRVRRGYERDTSDVAPGVPLSAGRDISIELVPKSSGEYELTCVLGKLSSRLLVGERGSARG